MLIFMRACALSAYVTATIYGVTVLKKNKLPPYFKCAFYATLSLMMMSLFNLVLATDTRLDSAFTLSVFGEISACIFVTTANKRFIPKEEEERKKYVSIPAALGAALLAALLMAAGIRNRSTGSILCMVLYLLFMVPCCYRVVDTLVNKYKNPFKDGARLYSLLMLLWLFATAALQFSNGVLALYTVLGSAAGLFALPLLKKGLEPWVL